MTFIYTWLLIKFWALKDWYQHMDDEFVQPETEELGVGGACFYDPQTGRRECE